MTTTKKQVGLPANNIEAAKYFRPLFRYVLCKKIAAADKKTAGGIILGGQKEAKLAHTNKAIIVALGSKSFEYERNKPVPGDIVHFTRYEDFIIDHSTEFLEGEYCMIYDEYVTCVETSNINKKGK